MKEINTSGEKIDAEKTKNLNPSVNFETRDAIGRTPILLALGTRPRYGDHLFSSIHGPFNIPLIHFLVNQSPLNLRNSWYGHLPLHWACINAAPVEVVKLLLDKFPDAAKIPGDLFNLPLHLALFNGSSFEVIKLLLEVYKDAATIKGEYGRHALHFACLNQAPYNIINLLCETNNHASHEFGDLGNLPIHLAVKNKASFEVIKRLLDSYPEGAMKKDDHGKLPSYYLEPLSPAILLFQDTEKTEKKE
jgi:hypothetical protein